MFLLINVIHDAGPIARNDVIVGPCGHEYGFYPLNGGTSWLSRLSEVLPPLRSWVRALYRTADCAREEFVNTLPKIVGFLWVLRFPPTGKLDRVAWD